MCVCSFSASHKHTNKTELLIDRCVISSARSIFFLFVSFINLDVENSMFMFTHNNIVNSYIWTVSFGASTRRSNIMFTMKCIHQFTDDNFFVSFEFSYHILQIKLLHHKPAPNHGHKHPKSWKRNWSTKWWVSRQSEHQNEQEAPCRLNRIAHQQHRHPSRPNDDESKLPLAKFMYMRIM